MVQARATNAVGNGTGSPAATNYTYQAYRNGSALSGATKSTYLTPTQPWGKRCEASRTRGSTGGRANFAFGGPIGASDSPAGCLAAAQFGHVVAEYVEPTDQSDFGGCCRGEILSDRGRYTGGRYDEKWRILGRGQR